MGEMRRGEGGGGLERPTLGGRGVLGLWVEGLGFRVWGWDRGLGFRIKAQGGESGIGVSRLSKVSLDPKP